MDERRKGAEQGRCQVQKFGVDIHGEPRELSYNEVLGISRIQPPSGLEGQDENFR